MPTTSWQVVDAQWYHAVIIHGGYCRVGRSGCLGKPVVRALIHGKYFFPTGFEAGIAIVLVCESMLDRQICNHHQAKKGVIYGCFVTIENVDNCLW